MMVVRAFGGAEDGCTSCDVRASVEAEMPSGPCTIRVTGTAGAAAGALHLSPELVPVARQLLADGVAALTELLATCRDGSALLLAAAGDLQLWVRRDADQQQVIALARRSSTGDAMVAAPRGADLYLALGRVERHLQEIGILQPACGQT